MPAYLIHQFEEYALNMTPDGSYLIIDQVYVNAGAMMSLSNLPLAHFPLVAVVIYATVKKKFMSGGALAVSLVSGFLAHGMLGAGYAAAAVGGPAAAIIVGGFAGFSPIVFAWLGCKIFRVRYLSPIETN